MPKTLVIDNYDSFTYNLVHLIADVNQVEPIVIKNDECDWAGISRLQFDNIVISPGPGNPDCAKDFGVARAAIQYARTPILGVCLGHQGMGLLAGGRVVRAPVPTHGKTSRVRHNGRGLFSGLPDLFSVARYHSLMLERPLPPSLLETAWTEEGLLMGFEHRERPQWGVQFHPESILTEHGRRLMENFRDLTRQAARSRSVFAMAAPAKASNRRAFWRELPQCPNSEHVFSTLYAESTSAYWLDSSLVAQGLSRWSYLGDASGPHGAHIEYDSASQRIDVRDAAGHRGLSEDIFDYLNAEHRSDLLNPPPCPFKGGHVGWFGYELRPGGLPSSSRKARTPDALFVRSDRFVAIDHLENRAYAVAIDDEDQGTRASAWLAETESRLAAAAPCASPALPKQGRVVEFVFDRDEIAYLADVQQCLDWIGKGETYQVCLTNEITCPAVGDPLDLYRLLRRVNPAPYAAFIRWPGGAVMSASPERFLQVDAQGRVETKPIKGTARRDADPVADVAMAEQLRTSEKDRAENVMIVDLLRNDLSRVCEVGSVVVPKLFGIESFATVHQLVSTIQGTLRPDCSVVDLICATFPGGSMTGAPKVRTLELIDQLESRARGVYSGALGWISNDGAIDLSIVIRTVVQAGGLLHFGVGGGVVANSTPAGEFAEMLLKAQASMNAIRLATAAHGVVPEPMRDEPLSACLDTQP